MAGAATERLENLVRDQALTFSATRLLECSFIVTLHLEHVLGLGIFWIPRKNVARTEKRLIRSIIRLGKYTDDSDRFTLDQEVLAIAGQILRTHQIKVPVKTL